MTIHEIVGTISQSKTGKSLTIRHKGKIIGFVNIREIEDCLSCSSTIAKVTLPANWKPELETGPVLMVPQLSQEE